MKSLLIFTTILTLTASVHASDKPNKVTAGDNFVLIYTGTACRNKAERMADPTDKNVYLIEAATIYQAYRDRGVPAKNIYILYKDAKPDLSEKAISKQKEGLTAEFNSNYSNLATVENLELIEKRIERQLNENTHFHLVMNAHGVVDRQGFYISSEQDRKKIRPRFLNQLLSNNRGRQHVFAGACFSGHLLSSLKGFDAIVTASCPSNKSSWLDRTGFFAKFYFSNLPQDLNASDDEYRKGFEKTKRQNLAFGQQRIDFIVNDYGGDGISNARSILSWRPEMKILRK